MKTEGPKNSESAVSELGDREKFEKVKDSLDGGLKHFDVDGVKFVREVDPNPDEALDIANQIEDDKLAKKAIKKAEKVRSKIAAINEPPQEIEIPTFITPKIERIESDEKPKGGRLFNFGMRKTRPSDGSEKEVPVPAPMNQVEVAEDTPEVADNLESTKNVRGSRIYKEIFNELKKPVPQTPEGQKERLLWLNTQLKWPDLDASGFRVAIEEQIQLMEDLLADAGESPEPEEENSSSSSQEAEDGPVDQEAEPDSEDAERAQKLLDYEDAKVAFEALDAQMRQEEEEKGFSTETEEYQAAKKRYEDLRAEVGDAGADKHETGNSLMKIIEQMPQEEREKAGLRLRNAGYWVEEKKNRVLSSIFGIGASRRNIITRAFASLKSDSDKKAKEMSLKMDLIEEGEQRKLGNAGYLAANALKYGRIATDLIGATAAMPLRFWMLGTTVGTKLTGALKEGRLTDESMIEKTRIQDTERAADEAWALYERVKTENGGNVPDSRSLEEIYRKNLPKDLLERLSRGKNSEVTGFVGKVLKKYGIKGEIERAEMKLAAIENNKDLDPAQRKLETDKLLASVYKRMADYDRMISDAGTIDVMAQGLRGVETAGNVAQKLPLVQTAEKLIHSGLSMAWEQIHNLFDDAGSSAPAVSGLGLHDTAAAAPIVAGGIDTAPQFLQDLFPGAPTESLDTVADTFPPAHAPAALDTMPSAPDTMPSDVTDVRADSVVHPDSSEGGREPVAPAAAVESTDATTEAPASAPAQEAAQATEPAEPAAEPTPAKVEATPDMSKVGVVDKGEYTLKATHEFVDKGLITEEEYQKATMIKMPDGTMIPKNELGLVHPGDYFTYVPPTADSPAHFEFHDNAADGMKAGTNAEYARILEAKGVDTPGWLDEALGREDLPDLQVDSAPDLPVPAETAPDIHFEVPEPKAEDLVSSHEFAPEARISPALENVKRGVQAEFIKSFFGGYKGVDLVEAPGQPLTTSEVTSLYTDPSLQNVVSPSGMNSAEVQQTISKHTRDLALMRRYLAERARLGDVSSEEVEYVKKGARQVLENARKFGNIFRADWTN